MSPKTLQQPADDAGLRALSNAAALRAFSSSKACQVSRQTYWQATCNINALQPEQEPLPLREKTKGGCTQHWSVKKPSNTDCNILNGESGGLVFFVVSSCCLVALRARSRPVSLLDALSLLLHGHKTGFSFRDARIPSLL